MDTAGSLAAASCSCSSALLLHFTHLPAAELFNYRYRALLVFCIYAGTFLEHVQQSTLFSLVARARRFFVPGAATEIWSLLRPHLVYGDPMGTQTHLALGWLVLFFPTKQIPETQPAVAQGWVGEWLGVWGRLVSCSYWDGHWMYLLARAVKDDWKGELALCSCAHVLHMHPDVALLSMQRLHFNLLPRRLCLPLLCLATSICIATCNPWMMHIRMQLRTIWRFQT